MDTNYTFKMVWFLSNFWENGQISNTQRDTLRITQGSIKVYPDLCYRTGSEHKRKVLVKLLCLALALYLKPTSFIEKYEKNKQEKIFGTWIGPIDILEKKCKKQTKSKKNYNL